MHYKILEEDNIYTLLIIESLPEDSGTYECVAINQAGEARCEAELVIESGKKGAPTPAKQQVGSQQAAPAIVDQLTEQIKKEGQPALFKCKISAKPGNTKIY